MSCLVFLLLYGVSNWKTQKIDIFFYVKEFISCVFLYLQVFMDAVYVGRVAFSFAQVLGGWWNGRIER